ncbi:LacI family DNA-binding transcriptional regulator [Limibacter armeniacum]|uniref:LacI family DNA-binding transcriptional regulator n=1 Tax=Limibacter armeniacum TaxID=466084 RepID=UPI002FE68E98
MKKNYTITDLAIRLGISKSTVSRALKDHPDVNMATRAKVKALAEELNYQPNLLASGLASKKSYIIGVIVPEISQQHFFAKVLEGIQHEAKEQGYSVMICQSDECFEEEVNQAQILRNNRAAGVLISLSRETQSFKHIENLKNSGVPVVLFDRTVSELPVSQVVVDDYKGAFELTHYLLEKGYRDIAYLSGPMSLEISRHRYEGYLQALRDYDINTADSRVYECLKLSSDVKEAVRKMLLEPKHPEAIMCVHDYMAVEVVRYLKERNIQVPQDIAVTGFAGDPVTDIITPTITTMKQPAYEMGRAATAQLIKEINAEDWDEVPAIKKVFDTVLQIKASTR